MNVYDCVDTPNTLENFGLISENKNDIIGITTTFNADIKLRGHVAPDKLLRPYFRMKLLNTLCHIHNIISEKEWLCAIHTNDFKGFSLYKGSFDQNDVPHYCTTKCNDKNIVAICDKIVQAYDDEVPEILNEYFA